MTLLAVEGLTKSFGGLVAVRDLSFDVEAGEITGLIGPNGAGKTTTFALLAGFLKPTAGRIAFEGEPIDGLTPDRICGRGIARTFQIMQSFAGLTVLENVMIGAFARNRAIGPARARAMAVLERLGIANRAHDRANALTLADLKRLEIARALATGPKILLLDEVISGLTPTEVNALVAVVRQIRDDGVTIVMIEHVMQAVMSLSDRIVVLHHGEKIAEGPPAAISRDPAVVEAYLGEDVV